MTHHNPDLPRRDELRCLCRFCWGIFAGCVFAGVLMALTGAALK